MQKNEIRTHIKALKKRLDEQTKAETASAVFALLESCPEFQNAHKILVYHALPDELPTQDFLQQWADGKQLYLPRVNGEELDILLYSQESLHKGAFNILEPDGNECTDVETLDLIIVPAVAFDRRGNRLGRGKGFYDRLLQKAKCPKIGIAYHFQLLDEIPAEPHDIPMDKIITEQGIISIHNIT